MFEDVGNSLVDRAIYHVSCPTCGFKDWDGTFMAWPGRAHRSPSALTAFIREVGRNAHGRKCPDCHAEARLSGMRVFIMAGSIGHDIVAEYEPRENRTQFRLMGPDGLCEAGQPDGDTLRAACQDSMVRAGQFIAEMTPARAAEAVELLESVCDSAPGRSDAHLALARLALEGEDVDTALRHTRAAGPGADGDAEACAGIGALLGELALGTQDGSLLEDAVGWYRKAIEAHPEDRRLDLALARLLVQSGNFEPASAHLDRASRHGSTALEARYLTGVMFLHQERPRAAAKVLTALASDAPGDPSVLHMLAWAQARAGDSDAAQGTLARAARLGGAADENAYFVELVNEALEAANGES